MPVDTQHRLYAAHERQAQRVRDAVAGDESVQQYLRNPDPNDEKRTKEYREGAVWLDVTARTHNGMLGAIFRKPPESKLPQSIEYLQDDADGSGMSLEQFAKLFCSYLMQAGSHGVLVDFPEAEDGLTKEQSAGLKASFRHYTSDNIINWNRQGELLTLVVLRETFDKSEDEFQSDPEYQYRVLRLEDGVYTQEVYRDGQPAGTKVKPRMGNGQAWPIIPFQFGGAVNNDEAPDKPMLLGIANLNIAHYRNSADWEESSFTVGQVMPHVDAGTTSTQDWQELNPNGIRWGSREGVVTQGGGSMNLVQAQPNSMPMEGMKRKEEQMLSIGARLIEQRSGNETAEAVRARSGAENSNLSTIATNVSDALRNCLQWALTFMTRKAIEPVDTIEFELNQQFYAEDADPQEVIARIQELDRGLIAKKDYRDWRRRTGGIDPERTDEEIDADVATGGTDLGVI